MVDKHDQTSKDCGFACRIQAGEHPAGAQGLWGTRNEVPSFLYGMPLGNGRVFLEETCLVSKPGLPFATLKRRLERRLDAMGIKASPAAALNKLMHLAGE